jgi:hypothetical protein
LAIKALRLVDFAKGFHFAISLIHFLWVNINTEALLGVNLLLGNLLHVLAGAAQLFSIATLQQ